MFGGERKGNKEKKRKKWKEKGKKEKGKVIFLGFWVLSMGREQERESGVRKSTFSLRFTEIEPSVFFGTRGKVHLRDECFA